MKGRFALFTGALLALSMPDMSSGAGWELYDDFSSGVLDQEKWENRSTVSTMSIENGQLKIFHDVGSDNKSGYLQFIQDPGSIIGIKANITITSCTGRVRARLAANPVAMADSIYWTGLHLDPFYQRIYSNSDLETLPDYQVLADTHHAQFKSPLQNMIGTTYTASMWFTDEKVSFAVEGLGKQTFTFPPINNATSTQWRVIGTRASNGDGPCTIYFDDVYVQRKAVTE